MFKRLTWSIKLVKWYKEASHLSPRPTSPTFDFFHPRCWCDAPGSGWSNKRKVDVSFTESFPLWEGSWDASTVLFTIFYASSARVWFYPFWGWHKKFFVKTSLQSCGSDSPFFSCRFTINLYSLVRSRKDQGQRSQKPWTCVDFGRYPSCLGEEPHLLVLFRKTFQKHLFRNAI